MEILELKRRITEVNLLEGLCSSFEMAEERITDLRDRLLEIMQSEE